MLKKLCFENFNSFRESVEIDFSIGANAPSEIKNDLNCVNVMGIKGSNGSGKTSIIKSISFLRDFCNNSMHLSEEEEIPFQPYRNNEDKPTNFTVDFYCNNEPFKYELSILRKKVISEVIYNSHTKTKCLVEREGTEIKRTSKDLKELKNILLKENTSIISAYQNYKFESKMSKFSELSSFFIKILTNVYRFGYAGIVNDINSLSKQYNEDKKTFDFLKTIITNVDPGISDIKIKERINEDGDKVYFPAFLHKHKEGNFWLTLGEEAHGTKELYKTVSWYALVLSSGGLLALDEFDIHLHSLILPKLLSFFDNKILNTKGAQLIFTAHNTEIIETLGKYRTILVNKDENESFCYRLDDIPGTLIRNDRAITPLYLKGKIGGVPVNAEIL